MSCILIPRGKAKDFMHKKTSINVLLIQSDAENTDLIETLLAVAGYEELVLHNAGSIEEAQKEFEAIGCDVILLDIDGPKFSGSKTIRKLQKVAPMVPIVIIGKREDVLSNAISELGVHDYLVKGVGDGHLIARSIRYAIEREQIQKNLSYLAHYDKLTDLPNRELFNIRLKRGLARADRSQKMLGLMFMDLDRFKEINDSLGHAAGDELLVMVSKRLQRCVRETDTIARLGGDEFTVIVEGVRDPDNVAQVAEKILNVMKEPFVVGGQEVFVTPSIGVTIYPLDGDAAETLIKNADTAMYRAKEEGSKKYQFYSSGMNTRAHERLKIEAQLHKALERQEFSLVYQPKVDMINGEIIGAEALIRWINKEEGFISPVDFIPLAEVTGLIIPIGEWVIRNVCQQIRTWKDKGLPEVRIAVNLSARQFRQGDLATTINGILAQYDLTPDCLPLEITESLLMSDKDKSKQILNELKAMGFQIYLDDFGTGYSSLSYLKKFPIDALKIDRSFVMDIPDDTDDMAISSAIVAMSHALRLEVVAEGIETMEQYDFLRNIGCEEAQGYLFSKPLTASEFEELLINPPDFSETIDQEKTLS